MAERVRRRHAGELRLREPIKGSPARRENEPGKRRVAAESEALKERGMLAVHGNEVDPPFTHGAYDELAAAHERLLVGKGDLFARLRCEEGIPKPREPARCNERNVAVLKQARLLPFCELRHPRGRRERTLPAQGCCGHEFRAQRLERRAVPPAGERGKREFFGIAADDIRRLPADAARTADECDPDHLCAP